MSPTDTSSNVYKVVEIVGSSPDSIADAVRVGIARAAKSLRHIGWFEVIDTRGHVENGQVKHFQVTMKVGFTMED
jgi:flavin-binding protein dodecin